MKRPDNEYLRLNHNETKLVGLVTPGNPEDTIHTLKGQPILISEPPLTRGLCCEPIASLSIATGFLGEGLMGLAWMLNPYLY